MGFSNTAGISATDGRLGLVRIVFNRNAVMVNDLPKVSAFGWGVKRAVTRFVYTLLPEISFGMP